MFRRIWSVHFRIVLSYTISILIHKSSFPLRLEFGTRVQRLQNSALFSPLCICARPSTRKS
jgi:hypothetical protein